MSADIRERVRAEQVAAAGEARQAWQLLWAMGMLGELKKVTKLDPARLRAAIDERERFWLSLPRRA